MRKEEDKSKFGKGRRGRDWDRTWIAFRPTEGKGGTVVPLTVMGISAEEEVRTGAKTMVSGEKGQKGKKERPPYFLWSVTLNMLKTGPKEKACCSMKENNRNTRWGASKSKKGANWSVISKGRARRWCDHPFRVEYTGLNPLNRRRGSAGGGVKGISFNWTQGGGVSAKRKADQGVLIDSSPHGDVVPTRRDETGRPGESPRREEKRQAEAESWAVWRPKV